MPNFAEREIEAHEKHLIDQNDVLRLLFNVPLTVLMLEIDCKEMNLESSEFIFKCGR